MLVQKTHVLIIQKFIIMKKLTFLLIGIFMSSVAFAQVDYSQVYIIGDAVGGWDIGGNSQEMTPVEVNEDDAIYCWSGSLDAGTFKFLNLKEDGTWLPSFNYAGNENKDIVFFEEYPLALRTDFSEDDYQFNIVAGGMHTIVINMKKLTVKVLPGELKLIGNAFGGFGLEDAVDMHQSAYDTFTWTGKLQAGAEGFKVLTGNYYQPCLNAAESEKEVTAGGIYDIVYDVTGENDHKFVVPAAGYYTITINTSDFTMTVENASLYLIGGATAAGWTIENAVALTRDASEPNIFVFEGVLKTNADESLPERDYFKIVGQKGWNPFSLHPDTNGEDISNTTLTLNESFNGSFDDNKWMINQNGRYKITVDLMLGTIVAEYLGTETSIKQLSSEDILVRSANNAVEVILPTGKVAQQIELFNIAGTVVASEKNASNAITLGTALPTGIYLLKISCDSTITTQKVPVK